MATPSTLDQLDAGIEDIAENISDTIDLCVDALMGDGAPFGMEKQTQDEQIASYVQKYRGNQDAWENFIRAGVGKIQQELAHLPPEKQIAARPYNIMEAYAYAYSAKMERLIARRGVYGKETTEREALRPLVPDLFDGEPDDAAG